MLEVQRRVIQTKYEERKEKEDKKFAKRIVAKQKFNEVYWLYKDGGKVLLSDWKEIPMWII